MTEIRVRFAPSPTGKNIHIGHIRSALYNFLFARKNKGKFILRIEDTDRTRYVEGAVEAIIKGLADYGIEFDEGPHVGGPYTPYVQSERLDKYQDLIKQMIDKGVAYYCFCSSERLDELREKQRKQKLAPKYDRQCLNLSKEEINQKIDNGEKYVVRFRIPDSENPDKAIKFKDYIHGNIKVKLKDLDDFILLKSDGFPTYHLAMLADDHEMKISHVMRSDEWLPSLPKHILLYQSMGWEPPVFVHLPPIVGENRKKLSKRDGAKPINEYIEQGFLKEALINFCVLLGWNPGDDQEIMTFDEMIDKFDLDKIQKTGAFFDMKKLEWMNGMYIRNMDLSRLQQIIVPFLEKAKLIKFDNGIMHNALTNDVVGEETLQSYLKLAQERLKVLNQVEDVIGFLFKENLKYDAELLIPKKLDKEQVLEGLTKAKDYLEKLSNESLENTDKLREDMINWVRDSGLSNFQVLWPLRVSLTGQKSSPDVFDIMGVLGKGKVVERINFARTLLD